MCARCSLCRLKSFMGLSHGLCLLKHFRVFCGLDFLTCSITRHDLNRTRLNQLFESQVVGQAIWHLLLAFFVAAISEHCRLRENDFHRSILSKILSTKRVVRSRNLSPPTTYSFTFAAAGAGFATAGTMMSPSLMSC